MSDTGLLSLPWVQHALTLPGVETVLDAGNAEVSASTASLPTDHLFTALLRSGLIKDMLCAFSEERNTFWAFAELGDNVCGHPRTTHGGMTAALIDDTLGGLSYMLKQIRNKKRPLREDGSVAPVAPAGPAFTVQLDISYKQIVPAGSAVVVEATIESIEGRKMWLAARVLSGGVLGGEAAVEHAKARALFVVPRDWKPSASEDGGGGGEEVVADASAVEAGKTIATTGTTKAASTPRRAHSIEDDVLTEAGVERLALAAAAAKENEKEEER